MGWGSAKYCRLKYYWLDRILDATSRRQHVINSKILTLIHSSISKGFVFYIQIQPSKDVLHIIMEVLKFDGYHGLQASKQCVRIFGLMCAYG